MQETDQNLLAEERQRWEAGDLADSMRRAPERPETQAFQRLHTPLDAGPQPPPPADQAWYLERLGFPGQFPFTRGVQPTMYRSRFWTMRQYAGYGTAAEANERFKYLLSQGQTGLSVAFDLATQIGYDSDDPLAAGEVGQAGVAVDSLADMEALLDGIPLDKVSISMTINAPASRPWPAFWAASRAWRSAVTTRRWRCPPRKRKPPPSARSKSSPMKSASQR